METANYNIPRTGGGSRAECNMSKNMKKCILGLAKGQEYAKVNKYSSKAQLFLLSRFNNGIVLMDREDFANSISGMFKNTFDALSAAAKKTGQYVNDHENDIRTAASTIKNTAEEAAKSFRQTAEDIFDLSRFSKDKLAYMKGRIEQQGIEYRRITNSTLGRNRMVDSLAVGGDLLSDILLHGASADVQAAFAAAYPQQAQHISFEDAVRSLPDEHLNGLISGVKGKLFEMQYVDYLNDGHLPDGYEAVLATSATQPGWDIAIHGTDGHIADVLQMKATDSIDYVHHALERYPDIDVVTTHEVYSQLVMNGAADSVIDSGMSNADVTQSVLESADQSTIHMHWTPPVISLALIAFTAYTLKDADMYVKFRHFGERAGKSYFSYLVGGSVATATQLWWLGLLAGVGSRYFAAKGRVQRDTYYDLQQLMVNNENLLSQMRSR